MIENSSTHRFLPRTNNNNVLLARRELGVEFIKIWNLKSNDFSKYQYPFNLYQDFSKVSSFDSKYFVKLIGPNKINRIRTVVLNNEELKPILSLKEPVEIIGSKIIIFKMSFNSELLLIEAVSK